MINTEKIQSINGFVVRPLWNRFKTASGLYTHAGEYSDKEMPPCYLPIQAEIISAPKKSKAKKGDTIYFTWNAIDFQKCLSPRKEDNLFYLDHSYYAYKNSDGLFTFDGWALLSLIVEKEEVKTTESGIILSGLVVKGSDVVEKVTKKELQGQVSVIPSDCYLDLKVGDSVKVEQHTDVEVEVDETTYYRVRLDDILGVWTN